jgi:hypothetical protein
MPKRTHIFICSLLGAALLAGIANAAVKKPTPAPAPDTAQSVTSFGTTISPPIMELDGSPGQVLHESVKITNGSTSPLTYTTTVKNFSSHGTEGDISIDDDGTSSATYAAAQWFGLSATTFTVAVNDTAVFNFTVTIPQNAEAGGHYAAVLFQPKLTAGPEGSGAATIPRIGPLVLIRLPGATDESAIIEKLTPKTFVGAWDELLGDDGKTKILVAKNEDLNAEKPRQFFLFGGNIAFDLLFKNLGSVHVKPAGTMTITNIFGQKEADLALTPRNVFPGGERRVSVIWPGGWHWGLFYHAKVTALYGENNQIIMADTWFVAFPLVAVIAILVVLILVFLMRRRLKKIARILVRGE